MKIIYINNLKQFKMNSQDFKEINEQCSKRLQLTLIYEIDC